MHNPTKRERMADKIRKLLAQAADVEGTPEADVFRMKAYELVAAYGLEEQEYAATHDTQVKREAASRFFTIDSGKYRPMRLLLLVNIANALHGATVQHTNPYRKDQYILEVFAVEHHLDRIQFLFDILADQMVKGMLDARPPYEVIHSGEMRVYRRSWASGFARSVRSRLVEAEKRILSESTALALFRDDDQLALEAQGSKYGMNLKPIKTRRQMSASGFTAGKIAGRSAQMDPALG